MQIHSYLIFSTAMVGFLEQKLGSTSQSLQKDLLLPSVRRNILPNMSDFPHLPERVH